MRQARARNAALGLLVLAGLLSVSPIAPARAFEFFGLFGSAAPEPSASKLPYEVTFETTGDEDLSGGLQRVSSLYSLREDAPPDGFTLVQRARADFPPLIDALWAAGYYNARVTIEVAGVPLTLVDDPQGNAARAANALKGRARVPVKVTAELGPLFKLRRIEVLDEASRQPIPEAELPPRIVKLAPGDAARAPDIRAAVARIADWYRNQSYPLVKVPLPAPTVDHAALAMDVTFLVSPGRKAGIGPVTVRGPEGFPQEVVRSFIYLEEGEPYSPKELDDTRRSIGTIPAVGSVRIREADALDRSGNLPIFVEVTDRAPNLVGFSAGFSTVDGPQARAFYENRNLFGEAERFRIEGSAFLAPRVNGSRINGLGEVIFLQDIGARLTTSFLKPALGGSRFDFTLDTIVERNRVGGGRFGGYTDRLGGGTAGLRYRFDDAISVSLGFKGEVGQTSDVLGQVNYRLIGVPLTVNFDNTDKLLDPTTGVRVKGVITPYSDALGSSVNFTRATLDASTYFALDEDANYILAARGAVGTLLDDPGLGAVPANYRFFVGGGGSVRGYRYHTVGPRGPFGFVVGGNSMFEANFEARLKVTETIGIVPFFDIGGAYAGSVPGVRGDTRMAAGIGLRYYTGFGPIRVDLATPINPRKGDQPLVLYVSIGQSF